MNKTLYILRGVSGAGKTTFAKTLELALPNCVSRCADDFFYDEDGNYEWCASDISKAHQWCKTGVMLAMHGNVENIVVHNTNTSEKEIKPYIELAEEYNYKIVSLVLENRHGNSNVHNVPEQTLVKQEQRLLGSIKLR